MISFDDLTLEQQRIRRLEDEVQRLRAEVKSRNALIWYYRNKLGIKAHNTSSKTEVIKLIEQGLTNAEIYQLGYVKSTVRRIRGEYERANNSK
jgi:DNA-binding NarL/FixJ family response regulator